MQIFYNGLVLAPGGLAGEPYDFRMPQSYVAEAANLFRAPAQTWFPRANVTTDLGFRVRRQFQSVRDAQVFCATHANSLAPQGIITMLAGDAGTGTQQVNLRGATLVQVDPVLDGVEVDVSYRFHGGNWDIEDVSIPDEGEAVKHFSIALTAGDVSKVVTFQTPFGTAPTSVTAQIAMPSGGYVIICVPDWSTLTAAGVTFLFGAAIPGDGYTLEGEALS